MDIAYEVALILSLIGLSAIYAGMEAALYSQSDVKLRARLDAGESLPRILRLWTEKPNDVIATLLVQFA